jgi:plastocyanin
VTRDMSILSERAPWKRKALVVMVALSVLLVIGVLAASCGGGTGGTTASTPSSTEGTGGAQVVAKNLAFDPATVTIQAGESVTWTNQDSMNHTVVADNGEFESGALANGATFSFKFDQAGTYTYHCSIHPSMAGTVVVQ